MKKFLIFGLILALLLAGCARTPDPIPMAAEGPTTVEGKVAFTLADCYTAKRVTPPVLSGDYPVLMAPEGTTFLVVVLDTENLTTFGMTPESLMTLDITIGEQVYGPNCLVQTENGTNLEAGATIPAGKTARVYYLFTPELNGEPITLTATVAGQPYTREITPSDTPKLERSALGKTLEGENLTLTLESFSAVQKLKPSSPAPLHTFFDAGSGKTHLVLKTTVTNMGPVPVEIGKIAGVTVGTTACSVVLESEDGSDLSDTGTVDPGQSRTVYFAAVFGADQAGKKASITVSLPFSTHRLTATAN